MKIIIVESPTKVKHIQEFVGNKYKVMASAGHIREIADSGKYKIGVDYDNDFKTDWVVMPKKVDKVVELRKAAKAAEQVLLASDDDAEGEAIAWHLSKELKVPIVKSTTAATAESMKSLIDGLIKNYVLDYFDDEMNACCYETILPDTKEKVILWSGYLQHFLSSNDVLSSYDKKIMSEIYLIDINKKDNRDIYDELVYRTSIFKAVELQSNNISFYNSFMFPSNKLIRTRNTPFFFSPEPYHLLDQGNKCIDFSIYGFHFLLSNENNPFSAADKYHKFISSDDLDDPEYELHIKGGDIIYQTEADQLNPIGVYYVDNSGSVIPAALNEIIDDDISSYGNNYLFDSYIKKWIRSEDITISDEELKELNNYYYSIDIRNYILIPLLIYILKKKVEEILTE